MSDTMVSLRRKIGGAGDLQSVLRTMKALTIPSDEKPFNMRMKAQSDEILLRYFDFMKELYYQAGRQE